MALSNNSALTNIVYTKFAFLVTRYIYYKRVPLASTPFLSFPLSLKMYIHQTYFWIREYSSTIDHIR